MNSTTCSIPGGIRTPDLVFRKDLLFRAGLQGHERTNETYHTMVGFATEYAWRELNPRHHG